MQYEREVRLQGANGNASWLQCECPIRRLAHIRVKMFYVIERHWICGVHTCFPPVKSTCTGDRSCIHAMLSKVLSVSRPGCACEVGGVDSVAQKT